MIRALRPTDLLAFLAFRARAPANEALVGPLEPAATTSLSDFFARSLALHPGYETWVHVEHGTLFGLVSTRARFGADVWDVDHLQVLPSVDAGRNCQRLLAHVGEAAVEEGVQKIFLRLPEHSDLITAARQAGFGQYTDEHVFIRTSVEPVPRPQVPGLRPRRPADHQALFQLYSAAVPAQVRQVEAMTLQEWRWNDNWGLASMAAFRPRLTRARRDLILQTDEHVDAWLQVNLRSRTLQLLVDPRAHVDTALLLARGLSELRPVAPSVFAVRDYQRELVPVLEEFGFHAGPSHALLARMLAVRVPERRLVPARVV